MSTNGAPAPTSALPEGIVREAAGPEQVVLVWGSAGLDPLMTALLDAGHLPLLLAPAETTDLVELSGAPALLLVDADLLDDSTVAVLRVVRDLAPQTRVCVLAGPRSRADGLLAALRAGLSEVLDPGDEAAVQRLLTQEEGRDGERVLAVGAHPDDVEIGAGATLLRHRALGHPVSVLTLSRGAVGGHRDDRRREAVGAAVALSAELLMGDLPDTRMEDEPGMIALIEGVIAAVRPTTVYVHSAADNHQDHRAVHHATVIAARRVPQLFCYQSPSSRNEFAPTKFVAVDATIHGKVDVLASYRSQATRHYLEPDLIVASARYWARQLTHTRYAEPFEVLRASERATV
ncbi:PIG-L deacetylase family protein [Nocardioides lijunqiniae]|uniref:PIG-L deacetylase family protein n=1 Tax=Nocardioides lijunqiniae TaxID=2760832 RepID=UPI001878C16F|nr:PIG-L deacetylase family protein [Nocardioides lijunqiniae]